MRLASTCGRAAGGHLLSIRGIQKFRTKCLSRKQFEDISVSYDRHTVVSSHRPSRRAPPPNVTQTMTSISAITNPSSTV
ncbi:unnamed protein product, partial [Brenthis ino]